MLSIPCAAQADRHAWGISSFKQREAGLQRSRHCVLLLWVPAREHHAASKSLVWSKYARIKSCCRTKVDLDNECKQGCK